MYVSQDHWPLSEMQQRGTAFTGVFLKLERNRRDVINKLTNKLKEQLKAYSVMALCPFVWSSEQFKTEESFRTSADGDLCKNTSSTRQSRLGIKPNSTSCTCPPWSIYQVKTLLVTQQLNVFASTALPPLVLRQRSLQMQPQLSQCVCKASPERGFLYFTTHINQHGHFSPSVKAKLTP